MQRNHPTPGPQRLGLILLAVVLLLLFFAAVGASCTANPHLYSGRGLVVFVPDSTPLLAPF